MIGVVGCNTAQKVDSGWDIGDKVVLSDFQLGPTGKIITLNRNGVPIRRRRCARRRHRVHAHAQ